MVKASPKLSPVLLSFLGEETVLNSEREVSVEWERLSSELEGHSWCACLCVSFKITGEWLKQNKAKAQHLFSW